MLYEYAVDPECMGDWGTFRFLVSGFGVSSGRLISNFPRNWLKKTQTICLKNFSSFRKKQLVAEELNRIKKFGIVDKNRLYDGTKSWLPNALEKHKDETFHAIITNTNDTVPDYVLRANEILGNTPLWDVPTDKDVERTIGGLSTAIEILLRISNHILFVDKMFDPAISKWSEPLIRFIEIATSNRNIQPIVEYHFCIDDEELVISGVPVSFSDYCKNHSSNMIPEGINVNFCRISPKPGGEGVHARYVLTDKGGIRIDWGLDTGQPGQRTDVGLIHDHLWKNRWKQFNEKSGTFDRFDEVVVAGSA